MAKGMSITKTDKSVAKSKENTATLVGLDPLHAVTHLQLMLYAARITLERKHYQNKAVRVIFETCQ